MSGYLTGAAAGAGFYAAAQGPYEAGPAAVEAPLAPLWPLPAGMLLAGASRELPRNSWAVPGFAGQGGGGRDPRDPISRRIRVRRSMLAHRSHPI